MTDLTGALQKALFAKLSAVDGLPQVVSAPPTSTQGNVEIVVYPFVLLGADQVTDQSPKGGRLERHEFSIHVCRQSETVLMVKADQELVRAALHEQPISADGAIFGDPKALNSNAVTLEDGATIIGNSVFETWAQPA